MVYGTFFGTNFPVSKFVERAWGSCWIICAGLRRPRALGVTTDLPKTPVTFSTGLVPGTYDLDFLSLNNRSLPQF